MSAATNNGSAQGIYLYCLARPQCLPRLAQGTDNALRGVDSRYPVTAQADVDATSQLLAVISEVEIADFSEENLQLLAWVGERAGLHEVVVASMMDNSPVMPVKFGTIFRSHASLAHFIASHRFAIEQGLNLLQDKAEWSVKGYLLDEHHARSVFAEDDAGIALRRTTLSQAPGARYLQQKQLDALIEKALEAGLARTAVELEQALHVQAVSSTALRCHSSAMTGRAERMVFNASFLLSEPALGAFRNVLEIQQSRFREMGVGLELRGPWPPYNFCPDLSLNTSA